MDLLFSAPSPSDSIPEADEMEEQSEDDVEQAEDEALDEENDEELAEEQEHEQDQQEEDEEDDAEEEVEEEMDEDDEEEDDEEAEEEEDDDAIEADESAEEGSEEDEDAEGDDELEEDADDASDMDADVEADVNGRMEQVSDGGEAMPSRPTSPERQRRSLFFTPPTPHRSYGIDPMCALPHPEDTHTHCLASSLCLTHLLTGSGDGFVRDYDFYAGCNGQSLLTSLQKAYCGLGEGITKGGVLRSWWLNASDDGQNTPLPVYSLLCQMDALWGLCGTSRGHINLFTIRHEPGRIQHVLRNGHSGPVSCMAMGAQEDSFFSGGWDGHAHQWDLNTGQIVRTFPQYGSQLTSIAVRPLGPHGRSLGRDSSSDRSVTMDFTGSHEPNGIIGTTAENSAAPQVNGILPNGLYGQHSAPEAPAREAPSQPPLTDDAAEGSDAYDPLFDDDPDALPEPNSAFETTAGFDPFMPPPPNGVSHGPAPPAHPHPQPPPPMPNGHTHPQSDNSEDEEIDLPLHASFLRGGHSAINVAPTHPPVSSVPLVGPATYNNFSSNVLLTASVDGQVLLWDTRVNIRGGGVGRLEMHERTPPWCVSACWSSTGEQIYAGRRNQSVDVWDLRVLGSRSDGSPRVLRTLRNPDDSGPVTCVAAFPDGAHLVCASRDNIRLWNVQTSLENEQHPVARTRGAGVPFKIIAGHHGGIISQILIDATSKFMITASGDRGWNLGGTSKTVLVHEMTPIV